MLEHDVARIKDLIDQQRLAELRDLFSIISGTDIADFLMTVDEKNRVLLFRLLPRNISSDVLLIWILRTVTTF